MLVFLLFCFFNFSFEIPELLEIVRFHDLTKIKEVFEMDPTVDLNRVKNGEKYDCKFP